MPTCLCARFNTTFLFKLFSLTSSIRYSNGYPYWFKEFYNGSLNQTDTPNIPEQKQADTGAAGTAETALRVPIKLPERKSCLCFV